MSFLDWFTKPKPTPLGVKIFNVLGEQIDFIPGVWRLTNMDLRERRWAHVDLSGMCLHGANLEGSNLLGAKLVGTSFCNAKLANAEISFANAEGADFQKADLRGTKLYRTETWRCQFDDALVDADSDIPGRKVLEDSRVNLRAT